MKLTINKQIFLGYGIIIILVALVIGLFFISRFEKISELNSRIVDQIMPSKDMLDEVSIALYDVDKTQAQLNLTKSVNYLDRLNEALNRVIVTGASSELTIRSR